MQNESINNEDVSSSKKANAELLELITKNDAGKLPGILSIVFGILGIFILGLLFAPLAFFLAIYSLYKKRILLGIIGVILSIVALITSPSFWGLIIGTTQEIATQEKSQKIKQIRENQQKLVDLKTQEHQNSLPKFDKVTSDWDNDINAFCKDVAAYSMNDINKLTNEQGNFFFKAQEQFPNRIKEYLGPKTADGRKIELDQLRTLLFLTKITLYINIKNEVLGYTYYSDTSSIESLYNLTDNELHKNEKTLSVPANINPIVIRINDDQKLTVTKKDGVYYVK